VKKAKRRISKGNTPFKNSGCIKNLWAVVVVTLPSPNRTTESIGGLSFSNPGETEKGAHDKNKSDRFFHFLLRNFGVARP
jgi:hypothetical protein